MFCLKRIKKRGKTSVFEKNYPKYEKGAVFFPMKEEEGKGKRILKIICLCRISPAPMLYCHQFYIRKEKLC